jgi:hypothetical protein
MAGLEPGNVVVAGTGTVYVAPEGTPMPVDLAALAAPWVDVGYVSEDGAQFSLSRDTEEIMAWQSAEAVRVLTTAEPKTVTFELLEFDRDALLLAFRGGTFTGAAAPWTYEPPDAGASDVRALCIDGVDGSYEFRFCFPRVELQGDVEWSLVRTDAVRLPLEFGVLASAEKWSIVSDHPGFGTGVMTASGAPAQSATRADWDAYAESQGLDPSAYATKEDVIAAVEGKAGAVA